MCSAFGDSMEGNGMNMLHLARSRPEWKHLWKKETHTLTLKFTGNGQSSSRSISALSFNYYNYYYSKWRRKNLWIKQSFVFCMENYNCSSHFFWALLRIFITFLAHVVKVSTVCSMQCAQSKRARTENFYYWHLNVEPFTIHRHKIYIHIVSSLYHYENAVEFVHNYYVSHAKSARFEWWHVARAQ